jgi:hypothetical protein
MTRAVARRTDKTARHAASEEFLRGAITGHLRRMGMTVITPDSPAGALVVQDGAVRVVVTIEAQR